MVVGSARYFDTRILAEAAQSTMNGEVCYILVSVTVRSAVAFLFGFLIQAL